MIDHIEVRLTNGESWRVELQDEGEYRAECVRDPQEASVSAESFHRLLVRIVNAELKRGLQ